MPPARRYRPRRRHVGGRVASCAFPSRDETLNTSADGDEVGIIHFNCMRSIEPFEQERLALASPSALFVAQDELLQVLFGAGVLPAADTLAHDALRAGCQ
jgi:hypothetical protein